MTVRILFVNAINTSKAIQTVYPPLGLGYLVSSLREAFGPWEVECRITDCSKHDLAWEIRDFNPQIVGISAVSQNYNLAMLYAKIAKLCGTKVVVGGVHISMLPSSLTEDMDVGVIGEGEDTICALVDLYEHTGGFAPSDLQEIDGLVFKDNGKQVLTPPRTPIEPLDDLPLPARDLLEIHAQTYMFTSRGCPYRCAFCASSRFWGNVRRFSPQYIANEISVLVHQYGAKEIFLFDDIFMADSEQVWGITRELRNRGLLGEVSFTCHVRANMVSEENLVALKVLGIKKVGMGLESGSNAPLQYLKGKNISIADNHRAVNMVRKHGLHISSSFIIGSPHETKAEVLETLRFIRDHKLFGFVINVLTPYPGTPVWDYAQSKGLVSDKMDWSRLNIDFEDNPGAALIVSETLTRSDVVGLVGSFRREQKRLARHDLFSKGIRHPWKAIRYIAQRCKPSVNHKDPLRNMRLVAEDDLP